MLFTNINQHNQTTGFYSEQTLGALCPKSERNNPSRIDQQFWGSNENKINHADVGLKDIYLQKSHLTHHTLKSLKTLNPI